jgi:hypothetical protein
MKKLFLCLLPVFCVISGSLGAAKEIETNTPMQPAIQIRYTVLTLDEIKTKTKEARALKEALKAYAKKIYNPKTYEAAKAAGIKFNQNLLINQDPVNDPDDKEIEKTVTKHGCIVRKGRKVPGSKPVFYFIDRQNDKAMVLNVVFLNTEGYLYIGKDFITDKKRYRVVSIIGSRGILTYYYIGMSGSTVTTTTEISAEQFEKYNRGAK